jgi:hypothetical protein
MATCIPNNILFTDVLQVATKILTNRISCLNCKVPLTITCDVIINGSITGISPWIAWTPVPSTNVDPNGFTIFSGTKYSRVGNSVILNIDVALNTIAGIPIIELTGLPILPAGVSTDIYYNSIIVDIQSLNPLKGLISITGGIDTLRIQVNPTFAASIGYVVQGQIIYAV